MTKKFLTPNKLRILSVASAITAVVVAVIVSLPSTDGASVAAQQPGPRISKIEASETSNITLPPGQRVELSVNVYGLQDALDNSLAEGKTFTWDAASGSVSGEGRAVVYTAGTRTGTYDVTVSLDEETCRDPDAATDDDEIGCSATFKIQVRRASAPPPAGPPPTNPSGPIPSIITDSAGTAYSTFTPEEGGQFIGETFSISAGAGAVPNGEYIGISIAEGGGADNTGDIHQRYTVGGNEYDIAVVDASGSAAEDYQLSSPAEVCLPLPQMFRGNISDVAVVSFNDNDTLTVLQSTVKIVPGGNSVCGAISSLPATVAVGVEGAPDDFPTPTATPVPPATGAYAPSSDNSLFLLLIGIALASVGGVMLIGRRRGGSDIRG